MAAGLDPVEMNVLPELWLGMPMGSHATSFGWRSDAIEGAAGRRFRDEIEASTDAQQHGRAGG